ncbi:MAG: pilus assembly protein N-terminal domain-containing protein [Planctomycetaceae bacterium]|nr:pilus assembly protein N-terminal domain-containing protein [Planctomycetaceae bacterium]
MATTLAFSDGLVNAQMPPGSRMVPGTAQAHYQANPVHQNVPQIQQVQLTSDPRRPLDQRIQAMPRANQKLEVIENRSQLMVTRHRIRRTHTSDETILAIVDFSPTEISLLGLNEGTTDLWLWFEDQDEPLMYEVTVIRDPSLEDQRQLDYGRIERKLALLYPNSKVYLIPMSRKIIVRGQARDADEAAKILQIVRGEVIAQEGDLYGFGNNDNIYGGIQGGGLGGGFGNGANGFNDFYSSLIVDELQVPGEFTVLMRVRIAEISRSQLRRMGVDWNVFFNDGAHFIGQTFAGGGSVLTGIFDNGNINVFVDALASNGSARILEDAQLVTLSGEPAALLSGGEFAVPTVVGIGGAQGQTTSFRGFGTSIIATPTVVDHDLVRLQIVPELSAVSQGNAVGGIPGLDVRRVQTRVELREGQSIVLGGLFARRESAEVTRIPWLGEIPIVGSLLFHAKQATEDENEMLIIVTPEIVRPMDADQVPPLPGHYVTHPDDIDLLKYNRIEGNPDTGVYQLLPYGNGQGYGKDVGYNFFNPAPVGGDLNPAQTGGGTGPMPMGYRGGDSGVQDYSPHQMGTAPQGMPVYESSPSVPYGAPGATMPMGPQGGQYNQPMSPQMAPGMSYPQGNVQPTPAYPVPSAGPGQYPSAQVIPHPSYAAPSGPPVQQVNGYAPMSR